MFGLNPKKMDALMKQMGVSQQEISSKRVVIEKEDGSRLVIDNPSVVKIKMQGNESFQISGNVSEESVEVGISEEDVNTIVEKTGVTKAEAIKSLKKTRDLAESILELSN